MIANGKYRAKAVAAELGRANTGTEQIAVLFRLSDEQPHAGEQITWYGFFTEKTTDRTLDSLEHCGWDGKNLADLSGITKNEVELVIEEEEDNEGKLRARVRWVNGNGGVAMKDKMTPTESAAFANRMQGAILARKQRKESEAKQDRGSFDFGANKGGGPPV